MPDSACLRTIDELDRIGVVLVEQLDGLEDYLKSCVGTVGGMLAIGTVVVDGYRDAFGGVRGDTDVEVYLSVLTTETVLDGILDKDLYHHCRYVDGLGVDGRIDIHRVLEFCGECLALQLDVGVDEIELLR